MARMQKNDTPAFSHDHFVFTTNVSYRSRAFVISSIHAYAILQRSQQRAFLSPTRFTSSDETDRGASAQRQW
jgi:hypothetical protein